MMRPALLFPFVLASLATPSAAVAQTPEHAAVAWAAEKLRDRSVVKLDPVTVVIRDSVSGRTGGVARDSALNAALGALVDGLARTVDVRRCVRTKCNFADDITAMVALSEPKCSSPVRCILRVTMIQKATDDRQWVEDHWLDLERRGDEWAVAASRLDRIT